MHDSSMQSGCLISMSLQLGLVKVSFNVGMPKTNTMYHILAFEVQCRFQVCEPYWQNYKMIDNTFKVCGLYVVILLNHTPTFGWYVARLVVMNGP